MTVAPHDEPRPAQEDPLQVILESPALQSAARAMAEGVGQLGAQIQQLLSIRQRLLDDARQLLRRYEQELQELEREDSLDLRAPLDASPAAQISGSEERADGDGQPPRPAFFEGLVALTVAGATRIQTIQVLEDSLSRLAGAEQVYIRRWHAGTLWLELTMSGGVELIGELNRVLPFPFAVQSAAAHEIVISLEGER